MKTSLSFIICCVLLLMCLSLGKENIYGQELAHRILLLPEVRLGEIPEHIQVNVKQTPTDGNGAEALIDELNDLLTSDDDLEWTISDPSGNWVMATDPSLESTVTGLHKHEAVRQLLHLGPTAIPALLNRLDDSLATKIVVKATSGGGGGRGLFFTDFMHGNPLNVRESQVFGLAGRCYTRHDWSDFKRDSQIDGYTFKTGDICLVILGQIVGRDYRCLFSFDKYNQVIFSPVYNAELRRQLRSVWSHDNVRQYLLESLLLDLCTRGLPGREFDEGLNYGGALQIAAVERLLYYFPQESGPAVAVRLSQLNLDADSRTNMVKNGGVHAYELIRAVRPFPSVQLETLLRELQERSVNAEASSELEATLNDWRLKATNHLR